MKSKLRLCRTLCSTSVLLSVLCFLGLIECLHWFEEWTADGLISLTLPDEPGGKVYSPPQPPHLLPKLLPMEKSTSILPTRHPTPKARGQKLAKQSILLLAYARSGSSFTGELLSASRRAAYYYEPLFR